VFLAVVFIEFHLNLIGMFVGADMNDPDAGIAFINVLTIV
jgi:hypothetical protein